MRPQELGALQEVLELGEYEFTYRLRFPGLPGPGHLDVTQSYELLTPAPLGEFAISMIESVLRLPDMQALAGEEYEIVSFDFRPTDG